MDIRLGKVSAIYKGMVHIAVHINTHLNTVICTPGPGLKQRIIYRNTRNTCCVELRGAMRIAVANF